LEKEKPPILGLIQRGGQVVLHMLANVQQVTIKPIIDKFVAKGTMIYTDEYNIYERLSAWGYNHNTVCHARGEYARDEDGDGHCEIHVNTMEGFWSLLRSWLRPHRGISQEKLPIYLAFFQFVHFEGVELTAKRVTTNIGIIRDPGHPEPWIIAMPEKPGHLNTLEYSARWGIEPMFSDFKSRGFGIEDSHIQYPDRLARLILVMALALYWAVSTGMWDATNNPTADEKKPGPSTQKARTRKALLVHQGNPTPHENGARLSAHTGSMGWLLN
jgi:transposase-like protein